MSFTDLFESGEHKRNLGHFASIANMATIDGKINKEEEELLIRFAKKLDIHETEYIQILKNPAKFPINPHNSEEKRLERLYDLFKMIYVDHGIDEDEQQLVSKYAIGLGFTSDQAKKLIKRSIQIYEGGLDFDDYQYLLRKK